MAAWRPKVCKRCGASREAGVPISKLGYCPPCGVTEAITAAVSMKERAGPHWERFASNPRSRIGRPRPRGVVGSGATETVPESTTTT